MSKKSKQPSNQTYNARINEIDRLHNPNLYQGMGYYVPHGYTKEQIKKLFRLWNNKLQKSGHVDVECFSALGQSSTYFVDSRTDSIYQERNYTQQFYYDLICTYINYYVNTTDFKDRHGKHVYLYRLLITEYAKGTSLNKLVQLVSERSFYKPINSGDTINKVYAANKKRSKYFIYMAIRKMLNHCWLWHCSDINGELDYTDLASYNFLGLDVPNTENVINQQLQALNRPPIKLSIKESKLAANDKCHGL